MIECKFDNSMLEMIKSIIGAKVLSFEFDDDIVENRSFGLIRVNTSNGALDILNEVHEVDYFGSPEFISYFTCEKYENIVPFESYTIGAKTKKIMAMENIIEIAIVSDTISIPCRNYEIIFDTAIIIETDKHTYTISRDWHFMETMYFNIGKSIDEICPLQKVISDWNNDGEWEVSVERKVTQLHKLQNIQ